MKCSYVPAVFIITMDYFILYFTPNKLISEWTLLKHLSLINITAYRILWTPANALSTNRTWCWITIYKFFWSFELLLQAMTYIKLVQKQKLHNKIDKNKIKDIHCIIKSKDDVIGDNIWNIKHLILQKYSPLKESVYLMYYSFFKFFNIIFIVWNYLIIFH